MGYIVLYTAYMQINIQYDIKSGTGEYGLGTDIQAIAKHFL